MKVRFSGVEVGKCFMHGKKRTVKKKVDGDRAATMGRGGKLSLRTVKGDPEVEEIGACPLKFLGVGLNRHPEVMVEIGRTEPRKRPDA